MPKNHGTRREHIVPKEHMRRFFDNRGKITVCRYDGHTYATSNLYDLCATDNYYDSGDPYSKNSAESQLYEIETELHPEIDKVLGDHFSGVEWHKIMRYVYLLSDRSVHMRDTITNLKEDLNYKSEKDEQMRHILTGQKNITLLVKNYIKITDATNGEEFISADVPVVKLDMRLPLEEMLSKNLLNCPEEIAHICPISPYKCLIMYPKGSKYFTVLDENNVFSSQNINRLLSHYAVECIFYKSKLAEDVKDKFINTTNPTIMEIRKCMK